MKNKRKKTSKRQQHNSFKSFWIIALFAIIPLIYGIYLCTSETQAAFLQTIEVSKQKVSHTDYSQDESLQIPVSLSTHTQQLIHHDGYTVSYNKDKRIPNWVAYELTRQETQGNATRSDRFIADPAVKGDIATNSDYYHSGFDKGHMAPAADMKWDKEAMKESFYFSNICPQHPELNRRRWKTLEDKARKWAVADSAIIIICGPIVDKQSSVIGENQVTVPSKFFKVILSLHDSTPKAIGFLFKNERAIAPLKDYAVSIDSIEQLSGLDFFSSLPDSLEDEIESHTNTNSWNI